MPRKHKSEMSESDDSSDLCWWFPAWFSVVFFEQKNNSKVGFLFNVVLFNRFTVHHITITKIL